MPGHSRANAFSVAFCRWLPGCLANTVTDTDTGIHKHINAHANVHARARKHIHGLQGNFFSKFFILHESRAEQMSLGGTLGSIFLQVEPPAPEDEAASEPRGDRGDRHRGMNDSGKVAGGMELLRDEPGTKWGGVSEWQ